MKAKNIVIPQVVCEKLKTAYDSRIPVYVSGLAGFGKTAVIREFLSDQRIAYQEVVATDGMETQSALWDGLDAKCIVVEEVGNLETDASREQVLSLLDIEDKWIIIVNRGQMPAWLLSYHIISRDFSMVSEKDLRLGKGELRSIAEAMELEIDGRQLQHLKDYTGGNGAKAVLYLQHVKELGFVEEAVTLTDAMFSKYLEEAVIKRLDNEALDFFIQIATLQDFNVDFAREFAECNNVESILRYTMERDGFLKKEKDTYRIVEPVRECLRSILRRETTQEIEELYKKAGDMYRARGLDLEALSMYWKCGARDQLVEVLKENTKKTPTSTNLFELRHYFDSLTMDEIGDDPDLMTGLCMLKSMTLKIDESERWFACVCQKEKESKGKQKQIYRDRRMYLEVAMPHRDMSNILATMTEVVRNMIMGAHVPQYSTTGNWCSTMNGGLDFCEWSKNDDELAKLFGPTLKVLLQKEGNALVDLALAESYFEKGIRDTDVLAKSSTGIMKAQNAGSLPQVFVGIGLQAWGYVIGQDIDTAIKILEEFRGIVHGQREKQLYDNVDTMLCRLKLYANDMDFVDDWMLNTPDDQEEFYILHRYMYLTKIRVYIAREQYENALLLVERLLYYSELMNRTYIGIETRLLKAIVEYRLGDERWRDDFTEALKKAEEYHFVRIITREGAAVARMFEEIGYKSSDKDYYNAVRDELTNMQRRYPSYLKAQTANKVTISESARNILVLMAEGYTQAEIASELNMTVANVKYHCTETYRKLGTSKKTATINEAKRLHLI